MIEEETQMITINKVLELIPVGRSTIYSWMKAGRFPKSKKLGVGRNGLVVWSRSEVDTWIASKLAA